MNNPSTLHALIAKTPAARNFLAANLEAALPSTFPRERSGWWVEPQAGLALHGAVVAQAEGRTAALSAVGRMLRPESGVCDLGEEDRRSQLLADLLRGGPRALGRLEGAHVAAFWDGARQELSLMRDALGQRTLFVREDVAFFVVCSELAPLLRDPRFARRLDFESAYHYLAFGTALPGRTLARGISRVRAGHLMRFSPGSPLIEQRHFSPLSHEVRKVPDDAGREEIARALDAAILARAVPGRQALSLSGGVDSSYVALTLAEHGAAQGLETYTIHFDAPFPANEGEFAAAVARKGGLRHTLVNMSPADAVAHLPAVLGAAEPCAAWASLTHRHMLARIGGEGHRTLHSGLGADEVFGGYMRFLQHYRLDRAYEKRHPVPDSVDAFDALMWRLPEARSRLFPGVPRFFSDRQLARALQEPYAGWNAVPLLTAFYRECRRIKAGAHLFEMMVAHECQHRVPDLLFAGFEPIARENGVDTVFPFLDTAVVRHACGLGASERFWLDNGRWRNKRLLRQIAARRLPPEILARRPMSYNAPIHLWLKDPAFADAALAPLRRCALVDLGLLGEPGLAAVRASVAALDATPPQDRHEVLEQAWAVITLSAWVEEWMVMPS